MTEPRKIVTEADLQMAGSAVHSAMQILSGFDWRNLSQSVELFEGLGGGIDPKVFEAMKKDPQWEQKKRLFRAAADFTHVLEEIRKEVQG